MLNPLHHPIIGSPTSRATEWIAFLSGPRAQRTPKNYAICRQDLDPDHYAHVLLELHRAKAILKTVLRAEVKRIWPAAQPTGAMPLKAWAELGKAIEPKRKQPSSAKVGERA